MIDVAGFHKVERAVWLVCQEVHGSSQLSFLSISGFTQDPLRSASESFQSLPGGFGRA